ncbi:hypothetical protein FRC05_005095 [Tulasnella sp. 425]|nr:hypothetical protein FRC05_005095 [Tulasnella sp. 425]
MSVNLSSSAPTLTLASRRQPSSLQRSISQSPYPRAYSNSPTSNLYSYLADLEYPEERKRSFDKSVRNQITFTESPTSAMGSSWTVVGDRPGKKPKLGDYYDNNRDADYPSQIGYAVPAKPFGRSYAYPTSEERTNWWDDDEAEADKDDSSDDTGDSTWDELVEDQVQSTLIDPPRGRTMSLSPLGAVSVSKRSHSADSPPPETPRYKLWNESEEEVDEMSSACSVDSASIDLADEEGFKAYFDMVEAGNSSSKDRHYRRRSKSLTPPTSPPKTNACELFDHSVGEIEQGHTQAESSDYSMAPAELEEQEGDLMDVEFPSIYSPGTLSGNNGFPDFGAAGTPAPLGLELYGAARPPNPSPYDAFPNFGYPPQVPQFLPSFVYPCIPIQVGEGDDENGDGEVPDITSILNPEAFQEAPEGMEDDDLWKADYELMRRNLRACDHVYRFFKRIGSQPAQERRDRDAPRPYSKLGFYPSLSATDLPRYLEQEDEEAEAEVGRSNTSGSSSWGDLDGDEDDDYFKELPTFA